MGTHNQIPLTDVNSQLYIRQVEEKMGTDNVVNHGKAQAAAKEVLKKLSKRKDPSVQKNKTSVCVFYAKGNCKRALDCPFSHQTVVPIKTSGSKIEKKKVVPDAMLKALPVAAAPSERDGAYPSQNPDSLGTQTRIFRS